VCPAGEDKPLHLAGVRVEEAAGVQLAGESSASLTVAGVVVLVLSSAVMKECEQEHDSRTGRRSQSQDSASCSGGSQLTTTPRPAQYLPTTRTGRLRAAFSLWEAAILHASGG
jgi:hypothetical protein